MSGEYHKHMEHRSHTSVSSMYSQRVCSLLKVLSTLMKYVSRIISTSAISSSSRSACSSRFLGDSGGPPGHQLLPDQRAVEAALLRLLHQTSRHEQAPLACSSRNYVQWATAVGPPGQQLLPDQCAVKIALLRLLHHKTKV